MSIVLRFRDDENGTLWTKIHNALKGSARTRSAIVLSDFFDTDNGVFELTVGESNDHDFKCEVKTVAPDYVMISQPMTGISDEEVVETRNRAIKYLEKIGYTVLSTYLGDGGEFDFDAKLMSCESQNIPIAYMGRSITVMSHCKAVYFCRGWEKSRGCKLEHQIASVYGLDILYEDTIKNNEKEDEENE